MKARALLAAALLLLLIPALVAAHAELVSADPAPGATLTVPPQALSLTFTEPLRSAAVNLYAAGFRRVEGVVTEVLPSGDHISVSVPLLSPGEYTVNWDVIAADGHSLSGSYAFAVAPASVAEAGLPAWFGWAALLILAGALAGGWWFGRARRRGQDIANGV